MMHGLIEISEKKLNEEIILKIKTSNPHFRDEKKLTYSHYAAKYCMPDVALWMYYAGPPTVAITDETTPLQMADVHGHTFISHLLLPRSNSVYEHAILLWMMKNKHGQFDKTLINLMSKTVGSSINPIRQIRSKKDVMPVSLETMLTSNDLYIQALEDYYNAFIQSIQKSTIIAVDSLCALLFLVSNSKNILEIASLLLQKDKFDLLIIWMITNNIHPYQVIVSIRNESVIRKFVSTIWSQQGVLEYTINQILSEPDESKHLQFFIHIPKSDKAVFDTLLKCLADRNSDPECTRIISEMLKSPSDSLSKRVEKFQTVSPESEDYISPSLAAYFNDHFKKLNLVVRIGQPKRQQTLPNEAIMQILGFAKIKKDDSDESDKEEDQSEYENQATMRSMLSRRGRTALASVSSHLFHLVHRTPKRLVDIQSKRAEIDAKIQEHKTLLNENFAQQEGIQALLDQLAHEQESISCCQHRDWLFITSLICGCDLPLIFGTVFFGYETKVSVDNQASAIEALKNMTVTIANKTMSCFDYFFSMGACRGNFTHTLCKNPCNDYIHNSEYEAGYLIGVAFLGLIAFTFSLSSMIILFQEFKRGPERLDQAALSSYSISLQNNVNTFLETANINQTIETIKREANRRLENLGQEQLQLEEKLQHLSAMRSLLSKRYQFFSPRLQVDSGIGTGLSLHEHREVNLVSDSTQVTIIPASHLSDELATPLLGPELRENDDDPSFKCIIM